MKFMYSLGKVHYNWYGAFPQSQIPLFIYEDLKVHQSVIDYL